MATELEPAGQQVDRVKPSFNSCRKKTPIKIRPSTEVIGVYNVADRIIGVDKLEVEDDSHSDNELGVQLALVSTFKPSRPRVFPTTP